MFTGMTTSEADTEVVAKASRRRFSPAEKLRILREADSGVKARKHRISRHRSLRHLVWAALRNGFSDRMDRSSTSDARRVPWEGFRPRNSRRNGAQIDPTKANPLSPTWSSPPGEVNSPSLSSCKWTSFGGKRHEQLPNRFTEHEGELDRMLQWRVKSTLLPPDERLFRADDVAASRSNEGTRFHPSFLIRLESAEDTAFIPRQCSQSSCLPPAGCRPQRARQWTETGVVR